MNLVVQSFGNEKEYRRAIFLVMSYYAHCMPDVERMDTLLFTDNPVFFQSRFQGLPVSYCVLTEEKIRKMRGQVDFLHRMKIAVIEDSFSKTNDKILYADSDVFFLSDPMPWMMQVQPHVSFMHKKEYKFDSLLRLRLPGGAPFHAFVNYIMENKVHLADGTAITIDPGGYSFNAGVMMLDVEVYNSLPDVYLLAEQFYSNTGNHASEQYAFSIILSRRGDVKACDPIAHHFWHRISKQIMDAWLHSELEDDWFEIPLENRLQMVRNWTHRLPRMIKRHTWTLRDTAIQLFHEDHFLKGYAYALAAFMRAPFNIAFNREILYHTRRLILNRN